MKNSKLSFLYSSSIILLLTACSISLNTNAQVANYQFSTESGGYTDITGGTQHSTTYAFSNVASNISIGFDFKFNNVVYTEVGIGANIFIWFGDTVPVDGNFKPISNESNVAGIVSGLGMYVHNAVDNTYAPEVRSETTGTAPNRIFTVQWKDALNDNNIGIPSTENYNIQIQLMEQGNQIKVAYGANFKTNLNTEYAQVGLRGNSSSDFNNIIVGSDWGAPSQGTINNDSCTLSSSILPDSGQAYIWTPVAPVATEYFDLAHVVTLYPNPAHHSVSLSTEILAANQKLILFNSAGNRIQEINSGQKSIALEGLAPGIYLLRFEKPTKLHQVYRFVKE